MSSKPSREAEQQVRLLNQIMMEHAEFIRGLLDPTEEELMETGDESMYLLDSRYMDFLIL